MNINAYHVVYEEQCSCGSGFKVSGILQKNDLERLKIDWRLNHTCPFRSPGSIGLTYQLDILAIEERKHSERLPALTFV